MQKLKTVDIAKAITIILVVIGHYAPDYAPKWYTVIHDAIYTFHMPLFMFLSGFLYWHSGSYRKPLKPFIVNKFYRLMVPYYIISIIVITLKLLGQYVLTVNKPVTANAFLEMLYLPVAGYYLWFCLALFAIFVVVHLFREKRMLYILGILSLIAYIAQYKISFPQFFALDQVVRMLPYFLSGVFVSMHKRRFEEITTAPYATSLFGICVVILYAFSGLIDNILGLIVALSGIFSVCKIAQFICRTNSRTKDLLLKLSVASYAIYLTHTIFESISATVILKVVGGQSLHSSLYFAPCALVIIASGVLIPYFLYYKCLSKYGITRVCIGERFNK